MIFGVFVTSAALTLSPTPAPTGPFPHRHPLVALRRAGRPQADVLYSARFRRRVGGYLRLRLLELREENLARAADAIERRLPVAALLDGTATPP